MSFFDKLAAKASGQTTKATKDPGSAPSDVERILRERSQLPTPANIEIYKKIKNVSGGQRVGKNGWKLWDKLPVGDDGNKTWDTEIVKSHMSAVRTARALPKHDRKDLIKLLDDRYAELKEFLDSNMGLGDVDDDESEGEFAERDDSINASQGISAGNLDMSGNDAMDVDGDSTPVGCWGVKSCGGSSSTATGSGSSLLSLEPAGKNASSAPASSSSSSKLLQLPSKSTILGGGLLSTGLISSQNTSAPAKVIKPGVSIADHTTGRKASLPAMQNWRVPTGMTAACFAEAPDELEKVKRGLSAFVSTGKNIQVAEIAAVARWCEFEEHAMALIQILWKESIIPELFYSSAKVLAKNFPQFRFVYWLDDNFDHDDLDLPPSWLISDKKKCGEALFERISSRKSRQLRKAVLELIQQEMWEELDERIDEARLSLNGSERANQMLAIVAENSAGNWTGLTTLHATFNVVKSSLARHDLDLIQAETLMSCWIDVEGKLLTVGKIVDVLKTLGDLKCATLYYPFVESIKADLSSKKNALLQTYADLVDSVLSDVASFATNRADEGLREHLKDALEFPSLLHRASRARFYLGFTDEAPTLNPADGIFRTAMCLSMFGNTDISQLSSVDDLMAAKAETFDGALKETLILWSTIADKATKGGTAAYFEGSLPVIMQNGSIAKSRAELLEKQKDADSKKRKANEVLEDDAAAKKKKQKVGANLDLVAIQSAVDSSAGLPGKSKSKKKKASPSTALPIADAAFDDDLGMKNNATKASSEAKETLLPKLGFGKGSNNATTGMKLELVDEHKAKLDAQKRKFAGLVGMTKSDLKAAVSGSGNKKSGEKLNLKQSLSSLLK